MYMDRVKRHILFSSYVPGNNNIHEKRLMIVIDEAMIAELR